MEWERVWPALVGGLMIGAASAGLLALTAKTAGISGILDGILRREKGELGWKGAFVLGLIVGGIGLVLLAVGFAVSAYMSVLRFMGESIGNRPLLLLGVLMILVGIQLLTFGLLSEMIQRQHARSRADDSASRVRDVIR